MNHGQWLNMWSGYARQLAERGQLGTKYETANARCNLCDGEMPCYCEVSGVDHSKEDDARDSVDIPHLDN